MSSTWEPSDEATLVGDEPSAARTHVEDAKRLARGDVIGRYVVLDALGAGGMGVVYDAYDPELDRRVAIKLLRFARDGSQADRQRLLREAQAMARITHPNVVTVHDVGTDAGRVYLAMELIEGQTLRKWLAAARRPWAEVVGVFVRAGAGLRAAHAERLVHRDFKPDNVMVGNDGRVVVMDFGLARGERLTLEASDEPLASASGLLSTQLSVAGAIAGTPAYMSPEQLRGAEADVRSDQFGFCVALYEALYGVLPFRGQHVAELVYAILSGIPSEPPAGAAVPGFVRRAIERGLRPEPDQRWPSMDALLEALDDRPARQRRARLAYAAALVGTAATIAAGVAWSQRGDEPCSGAPARLAGVWDAARHDEVEQVVVGLDAPWAATTVAAALERLDDYASAWIDMHTEACVATRVHGAQSEALMDLRIGCLERARVELAATADQLVDADPEVLAKAHALVGELPSLAACADVEGLRAEVEPPADAAAAAEVVAIRGELAQARAARAAGRYAEAEATLVASESSVDAVDHPPVRAEWLMLRGSVHFALGQHDEARSSLSEALRIALSQGQLRVATKSAGLLTALVTGEQRAAEALAYANVGLGLAEHRGQPPQALAAAYNSLGLAQQCASELPQAEASYRRSLELDPGDDPSITARRHHDLGSALKDMGRGEEALAEFRLTVSELEAALGGDHPDLLMAHQSLGNALVLLRRFEEAEAEYARALAIGRGAFGEDHPGTVSARVSIATVMAHRGRFEESEAEMRAVLAAVERSLGPEHARAALVHNNLATVLLELGRAHEGELESRRALAIYAKLLPPDHGDLAAPHGGLGGSLAAQGRHEEAIAEFQQALAIRERTFGRESPRTATDLVRIASSLVALGRHAEAVPRLERAMVLLGGPEAEAKELARARFELAKALWPVEGERERARGLVRQAVEGLPEAEREGARAWLREHP